MYGSDNIPTKINNKLHHTFLSERVCSGGTCVRVHVFIVCLTNITIGIQHHKIFQESCYMPVYTHVYGLTEWHACITGHACKMYFLIIE